jgi:hypothetical protein
MLYFPMVTFIIGLRRDEEDFVSFHHLLVRVAFLTDLGMELLPECHHFGFLSFKDRHFMEAMTVTAGRRIRISRRNRLTVDTFGKTIIGMASRAYLNDPRLIPFPWGQLMDLFMAVFTLNIVDEMGAGIMLGAFFLMTTMAGDRLGMNSSPFGFQVVLNVRDIPMTTVAGVGSMDRLGKFPLIDFSVATQAFGVVDTLITVFATLDDKLLSFLCRLRRLGHFGRL